MIRFLKKIGRSLPILRDIHRYILALEAEREFLKSQVASAQEQLARETEKLAKDRDDAIRTVREEAAKEMEDIKEDRRRNWTWVPARKIV